jgi:hypothetical protein
MRILSLILVFIIPVITCFTETVGKLPDFRPVPFDTTVLNNNKLLFQQGNNPWQTAYDSLIQLADDLLAVIPYTVMNKTETAASGNKHDYYSFGPYWWPDSTKKNGLPWIWQDGKVNPKTRTTESDYTSLVQLSMATTTLTLAWYYSNNERYAKKVVELLKTWFINENTKMNPNLDYAQAIPGKTDGRGIGIIESILFINICESIELLQHLIEPKDIAAVKDWFSQYIIWLETSENGIYEVKHPNNHGSWYDAQMLSFCSFTGDTERIYTTLKRSSERIYKHIQPNGSQPHELKRTKTLTYSLFNLQAWHIISHYARKFNFDFANENQLVLQANKFLSPYAADISKWKYKQITPVSHSFFAYVMKTANTLFDQPFIDHAISALTENTDLFCNPDQLLFGIENK